MPATIMTIERHILVQQKEYPQATGTLTQLLYDMALAGKIIARETTRAGLVDILGDAQNHNIYGERQQKLDVFADEIIFKLNDHTGRLCAMGSEEQGELIPIPPQFSTGHYVLLYDPLDGSTNIDINASIGTIFAIHRKISRHARGSLEDALQPGHKLVAAGYLIYGSSTMMVYSAGHGVHGFTLEPDVGEFLLSHENIRMKDVPKYYSANQGYEKYWTPGVRRYVAWLQGLDDARKPLSHRYAGALVSDFHRNLLQGGVYFYPGDLRDAGKPYGKIRLMFEAQALAYLAEQAGGYASDGLGNILALQPHSLDQRVPIFIGNHELVVAAERFITEHDQDWIEAYRPYRDGSAIPD